MPLFGSKVSGIMGNLKIDREIADLESKKQSLIRSVQNDISALQSKITSIFTDIGSAAYASHQSGEFSLERFGEKFAEITALKGTIAEKESKISEISNRYDEEITLLRNLNAPTPEPVAATVTPAPAEAEPTASAGNCGACGVPYAADAVFCRNCGTKLNK